MQVRGCERACVTATIAPWMTYVRDVRNVCDVDHRTLDDVSTREELVADGVQHRVKLARGGEPGVLHAQSDGGSAAERGGRAVKELEPVASHPECAPERERRATNQRSFVDDK